MYKILFIYNHLDFPLINTTKLESNYFRKKNKSYIVIICNFNRYIIYFVLENSQYVKFYHERKYYNASIRKGKELLTIIFRIQSIFPSSLYLKNKTMKYMNA